MLRESPQEGGCNPLRALRLCVELPVLLRFAVQLGFAVPSVVKKTREEQANGCSLARVFQV